MAVRQSINLKITPRDVLLSCPFCGSDDMELCNTHTASYWIECPCGASVHGNSYGHDRHVQTRRDHAASKRSALAKWNRRSL